MSRIPGMILQIRPATVLVRVPTGSDCDVCPVNTLCAFKGPDAAYRTIELPWDEGLEPGDRVIVEQPDSILGIVALVVLVLPLMLLTIGYALSSSWLMAPYQDRYLWIAGIIIWASSAWLAHRWVEHAPRFRTIIELDTREQ